MERPEVRVKRLTASSRLPRYATTGSAGADLFADTAEELPVAPGETVFVPTGIALHIPSGFAGFVYARSGLASKRGLAPANKVGVIDSDYRGEVLVALHNHGANTETIAPGERIAQLVIAPAYVADFTEVRELDGTQRGSGGFGSTGSR